MRHQGIDAALFPGWERLVTELIVFLVDEIEAADREGGKAGTGRNANPRGQIVGDTNGLLKLVFAPADKKLLGVHIIGEMASELIHIGAHVMAEAGPIDAFIEAVYNYPTLSDSYKYAAYDGMGKIAHWMVENGEKRVETSPGI